MSNRQSTRFLPLVDHSSDGEDLKQSRYPSINMMPINTIFKLCLLGILATIAAGDLIMMDGNGMPSIIEDDEIDPDVILMPGMSNMIMNDDLVL